MSRNFELDHWEGRPVAEWRALWGLPQLHIHGLTGSTNDDVRQLAEAGAPALTVVIANQQTAGRGQHGRSWQGQPGKSLHLSALLRPDNLQHLPAAPVRLGLYVARALAEIGVGQVSLKWPNDLIVHRRKLGGILCEGVSGRDTFIVAGIGINVLHMPDDFPPELRDTATSIAQQGNPSGVSDIAGAVVIALQNTAPLVGSALNPDELAMLAPLDVLRDRKLVIDGQVSGTGKGIAADGALLVDVEGSLRAIRSGTVRLHEEPAR